MAAGAVAAPFIIPLKNPRTQNLIDDRTLISIQSETQGVMVFFTLDRSKPAASQTSKKYTGPISLPPGRVSVKAVAIASDGRESSTVTKDFLVDKVIPEVKQGAELFTQTKSGVHCSGPSDETEVSSSPQPGPCSLNKRLHHKADSVTFLRHLSTDGLKQSSEGVPRIRTQLIFKRCDQCSCLLEHPSSFCHQCGTSTLPHEEGRPSPAETGQVVPCVFCHSLVPANTPRCLICEEPVQKRLHYQNRSRSVPSTETRKLACPKCEGLNRSDAQFCNWCGSKQVASVAVCCQCGASGRPDANHCVVCGGHLQNKEDAVPDKVSPDANVHSKTSAHSTEDRSTQTVGLYYPSSTELKKRDQHRELLRKQTSDYQPPLTATSPGKGYWRKQLDHVCGHLRNFTLNHPEFRVLLGEPRLGRIVSATIQEDVNEVSLMINFMSQGGVEGEAVPLNHLESLSSVTERASGHGLCDWVR